MPKKSPTTNKPRRTRLGDRAEQLAATHISDTGAAIIARNFRSRFGEIDLIIFAAPHLAFVEVRYRGTGARASAADSVTPVKQRRIINTARYFLTRQPQWHETPLRFDVVAIDCVDDSEPTLHWIQNAFDASGYY